MRWNAAILLLTFFIPGTGNLLSQTYDHPNSGLKSHETLDILKIEITSENTIVSLSIENKIEKGTFCADRDIYILDSDGRKLNLMNSSGIPVCPESYNFKKIGEKLFFTLRFPPLQSGVEWIDIIEECDDHCFSFYGVILDNKLNESIDKSFSLAENNESEKAMISFIKIAESDGLSNHGAAGLLYLNIIILARETGNFEISGEWNNRLKASGIPRVNNYIRYINNQK